MELDQIDCRILRQLQADADISTPRLADMVGLSPSACLRRVTKLRRDGVIARTVAIIDPALVGRPLSAVITLEFVRHGPQHRQNFIEKVRKLSAVRQCFMVTGEVSCVLTLYMRDMDEYLALSDELFNADPNVAWFRTYIAVQTVKDDPGVAF